MPTELLSIGPRFQMVQNRIYALPGVVTNLFTDITAPAPTIQVSSTPDFANSINVTMSEGKATLSGAFVRATSGDLLMTLRKV